MLAQHQKRAESVRPNSVSAAGKQNRLNFLICGLLAVCVCVAIPNVEAFGGQFRVQTTVFDGEQIMDRRTTLFRDQVVIDFSEHDTEIVTLLDLTARKLTLVDDKNQTISRISADQIAQILAEQQFRIRSMPPELKQVLVPELTRSWDVQKQILNLGSPKLDYTATLIEPKSSEMSAAYRTFTDWMARFNAIRPGGHPPLPRLKLNQEIGDLELVPSEIRKTVDAGVARTQRTSHQYHRSWRPQDHTRANQVLKSQRQYREYEIFEFLGRSQAGTSGR